MSKRIENLHKRRKKLGLSMFRYFHAFMCGYADKGQKWKSSPYAQDQLSAAYWEGRKTRYNYDVICKDELKDKKSLTRLRT